MNGERSKERGERREEIRKKREKRRAEKEEQRQRYEKSSKCGSKTEWNRLIFLSGTTTLRRSLWHCFLSTPTIIKT